MGYEVLDHTADLELRAWGESAEEALAEAARGLFAQLCDPASVKEQTAFAVEARGADPAERAVHFLQEALAAWHLHRLLLTRFEVAPIEGDVVRGVGFGETYDPGRHEIFGELKAVTYHRASLTPGEGVWWVNVVVDL